MFYIYKLYVLIGDYEEVFFINYCETLNIREYINSRINYTSPLNIFLRSINKDYEYDIIRTVETYDNIRDHLEEIKAEYINMGFNLFSSYNRIVARNYYDKNFDVKSEYTKKYWKDKKNSVCKKLKEKYKSCNDPEHRATALCNLYYMKFVRGYKLAELLNNN